MDESYIVTHIKHPTFIWYLLNIISIFCLYFGMFYLMFNNGGIFYNSFFFLFFFLIYFFLFYFGRHSN